MSHVLGDSQPQPGQGQGRDESVSDRESTANELLDESDPEGGNSDNGDVGSEEQMPINQGASTSGQNRLQDLINQRILDQLTAIGSRLEKLEKKEVCKKTTDKTKIKSTDGVKSKQSKQTKTGDNHSIETSRPFHNDSTLPALNTLRQDSAIQRQIEQRIKGLSNQSGMDKVKSWRGGEVDIYVKKTGQVATGVGRVEKGKGF